MTRILSILASLTALTFGTTAIAADTDWSKVDQVLGRKGAEQAGGVHRYGLPRSDMKVTVDGVAIKPSLALGGWVLRTSAPVFYMHVGGHGDAVKLAESVRSALAFHSERVVRGVPGRSNNFGV
jgi:hypothetical protein